MTRKTKEQVIAEIAKTKETLKKLNEALNEARGFPTVGGKGKKVSPGGGKSRRP
tara:strand:+ start:1888 stop:2049 length:162 start_codon:yes stop_codon:yes gene_type:complete